QQMRTEMQPGTGVRTIGGLYARVKEVNDDTVVVEMSPGVHATFAKNAIGAVLEDSEYERIVNGHLADDSLEDSLGEEDIVVPDSPEGLEGIDLSKPATDRKPDLEKSTARDTGSVPEDEDDPDGAASAKNDDEEGPAAK